MHIIVSKKRIALGDPHAPLCLLARNEDMVFSGHISNAFSYN
jgi:hypothetical protein